MRKTEKVEKVDNRKTSRVSILLTHKKRLLKILSLPFPEGNIIHTYFSLELKKVEEAIQKEEGKRK